MLLPITWALAAGGLLLVASEEAGRFPPLPEIAEPRDNPPNLLIELIETRVRLPDGAHLIASYRRYYAVSAGTVTKPLGIRAIYTTLSGSPGRQWAGLQDLPMVFDGGCGFIIVEYDVRKDRITSVECNGVG